MKFEIVKNLNSEFIHGSIVAGVILMNEAPKHLNDGVKNKGNFKKIFNLSFFSKNHRVVLTCTSKKIKHTYFLNDTVS